MRLHECPLRDYSHASNRRTTTIHLILVATPHHVRVVGLLVEPLCAAALTPARLAPARPLCTLTLSLGVVTGVAGISCSLLPLC